jgi:hypothetical protein
MTGSWLTKLNVKSQIAYQDRSSKNIATKHTDLEQAISTFYRVLELTSRDGDPKDWATTQNNLANAYSDRIRGEKAANLED